MLKPGGLLYSYYLEAKYYVIGHVIGFFIHIAIARWRIRKAKNEQHPHDDQLKP